MPAETSSTAGGEKEKQHFVDICSHNALAICLYTATPFFFLTSFLTLCQRLLEGECVVCGIVQIIGDISTGICQVNTSAPELGSRITQFSCA